MSKTVILPVVEKPEGDPADLLLKDQEDARRAKAIDFAFAHTQSGFECPFCSKQFHFEGSKHNPIEMRKHLRNMHSDRSVIAWQADDITADFRTDEKDIEAELGLVTQDEYDPYNSLYIDPALRKEAAAAGDELRWSHPDKVSQWKNIGSEIVLGGKDGVSISTDENGRAKANEMTLVRIPQKVVQRIRDRKALNADTSPTSKEELNVAADAAEKAIYDTMVRRGHTTDVARQVARAKAGNLRRMDGSVSGNWKGGNPRARDSSTEYRGELR